MASGIVFTDSLDGNIELIRELLASLPPGSRNQARLAAMAIEKAVVGLQRDTQGNPGAALGAAFAIYMIAQRMVQGSTPKENPLIHLLN